MEHKNKIIDKSKYYIHNFSVNDDRKNSKEDILLPTWINGCSRCYLISSSGGGKTNLICNLLSSMLDFDTLFYYSPETSLYQPKLERLIQLLMIKKSYSDRKKSVDYNFTSNFDELDLNELDKSKRNIIVLDDALSLNKEQMLKMDNIMTTSRHKNVNVFVMSQSFFTIPKVSRSNFNMIFLFKVSSGFQLRAIYQDLNIDIDFNEFKRLYNISQETPYNFILCDKHTDIPNKIQIRNGFFPFENNDDEQ